MNIVLKEEWAGFPIGRKLTVSDNRGVYLKKIGVAEPDKKKIRPEIKTNRKPKSKEV